MSDDRRKTSIAGVQPVWCGYASKCYKAEAPRPTAPDTSSAPKSAQVGAPDENDWRKEAARWLRAKARGQEKTNAEYPRHVECYPSWEKRVRDLKWLAEELEGHPTYGSFGPLPIYEDPKEPTS